MSLFTQPSHLSYELEFPVGMIGSDRDTQLARQACLVEHVAHLSLTGRSKDAPWIARFIPQLAEPSTAPRVGLEAAQIVETRIAMSTLFNARLQFETPDFATVQVLHDALRTFDTNNLAEITNQHLHFDSRSWQDFRFDAEYMASGREARAYRVQNVPSIGSAVLKLQHWQFNDELMTNHLYRNKIALRHVRRAAALAVGSGVEGLEQLVAYSTELPATVTQFAPGETLTALITSGDSIPIPSDDQQLRLAETVGELMRRDLLMDAYADNVLFDDESGFTLLDYTLPHADFRSSPSARKNEIDVLIQKFDDTFGQSTRTSQFRDLLIDVTMPIIDEISNRY